MRPLPHRLTRRTLTTVAATLLVGTAACDSATAPTTAKKIDPAATLADYKAVERVFTTDGWVGLRALGGRSPLAASVAVTALRALPQLDGTSSGRRFATSFFRELAASHSTNAPLAKKLISPTNLGRTFVYDPILDQYVVDSKRTGAPSNGVRFILYVVDDAKHPIPSKEIGYADLLDEGTTAGETVVLRLIAVERGKTRIDYRTSVLLGTSSDRIDVNGFAVDDDGTQLDFKIGVVGTQRGGKTLIDATFDLKVVARNFRVQGSVTGVEEGKDGGGAINITAQHGPNSFQVDVTGDGRTIKGTIYLNGKPFVTVSGDAKSPTLIGPSGKPVSEQELQVVAAVIHVVDDVFALVEDLVKPVEKLLLLGWIL